MKRCQKLIRTGLMTESRRCLRPAGHRRAHTPDLSGLKFGKLKVVKIGDSYGKGHTTRWWCDQGNGFCILVHAQNLLRGRAKQAWYGFSVKFKAEYRAVYSHWYIIFKSKRHPTYKGMPFHEKWNPLKGGSFLTGALWVLENLGPKPGLNWSLDIIKHSKGFAPGNLRWALISVQQRNKQRHTLGLISDKEFAVEARRRGYFKRRNK